MPVACGVMKQTSTTPPASDNATPPGRAARGGIAQDGPGQMNNNAVSDQQRLPDPETRRIRQLDPFHNYSCCLVENPDSCPQTAGRAAIASKAQR